MSKFQQERKLATVRKIAEVKAIEGADKICAYRVDGWWVVDGIDKYSVDELVVLLEIDSWVPHELVPFLSKGKEPKEFNGIKGERLRTVKLKGQLSQGLILPLKEYELGFYCVTPRFSVLEIEVGDDFTDFLGITKWEQPIKAQLRGQIKAYFPSFIPKTDQPRIQNLTAEFEQWKIQTDSFEISEKMDGSSMTFYFVKESEHVESIGVCSRNLELKFDENNSFWKTTIELGLIDKLRSTNRNLAVQGELCGPGIQDNQYGFNFPRFFCYDIYDIDKAEYLLPEQVRDICEELSIPIVPIIAKESILNNLTVDSLLKIADGISVYGGKAREGLVFKHTSKPNISFKVISNQWSLKND